MIIGETVLALNAATTTLFSPWFERHGNGATFILEILAIRSATVTVTIQTKNSEDVDPGASATGGTFGGSAVNRFSNRNYNLKELVRFQFEVAGTGGAGVLSWVHMRMLNPAWERN